MIKVTFADSGEKLSLWVKGHAGYAEIGKDIVCASCSILANTVAQFVLEAGDKGDVESSQVRLDVGDAVITCRPKDDFYLDIRQVYLFAKKGFELLEHTYPQYVRLMP